jgi:hypothetical protein
MGMRYHNYVLHLLICDNIVILNRLFLMEARILLQ